MQGEKNLSVPPKFMSRKTNLLNFDKEIASSIGLYEAIVLQIFKSENKQNLTQLFDKLSFCLLYTSPSPRDVVPSRMPSSA